MPSPLGFDGGLTAGLSVRDLDKAIAWYTDVIGFTLLYKIDEMGWAELQTECAKVNLGLSQTEEVTPKGGATLTFGVKDLDVARAHLTERDVRFDGENQVIPGMVKLATFFDPDGNTLMLFEDLSGGGEEG